MRNGKLELIENTKLLFLAVKIFGTLMQINKCVCNECNTKIFVLRTLCGKGVDQRGDCSTNLRLDQDTVKLFKTDLRLENVWNNVCSEVGELKEKIST